MFPFFGLNILKIFIGNQSSIGLLSSEYKNIFLLSNWFTLSWPPENGEEKRSRVGQKGESQSESELVGESYRGTWHGTAWTIEGIFTGSQAWCSQASRADSDSKSESSSAYIWTHKTPVLKRFFLLIHGDLDSTQTWTWLLWTQTRRWLLTTQTCLWLLMAILLDMKMEMGSSGLLIIQL